jgi:hypothetical protein
MPFFIMIIAPGKRDSILKQLIEQAPHMVKTIHPDTLAAEAGINERSIKALLQQFEKRGLLRMQERAGGKLQIQLLPEAGDYLLRGGYLGEFQHMEHLADELKNELNSIAGLIPAEKYERIMLTVASIVEATAAYKTYP